MGVIYFCGFQDALNFSRERPGIKTNNDIIATKSVPINRNGIN